MEKLSINVNSKFSEIQAEIIWNKAGFLKINWGKLLGYPCVVYVNDWNQGLDCWTVSGDERERHDFSICQDPVLDFAINSHSIKAKNWRASIPRDIRDVLEKKFYRWRLPLIRLCKACPEAIDLLKNNPILLWVVWSKAQKEELTLLEIQRVLRLKQKDILERAGFVASNSAVSIMKRIYFEDFEENGAKTINLIFSNKEIIDGLRHVKNPDLFVLEQLVNWPWVAGKPILRCFEKREDTHESANLISLIHDCVRICDALGYEVAEEIGYCSNVVQLVRKHDRLAEEDRERRVRIEQRRLLDKDGKRAIEKFPEPPFPGNDSIMPLCSIAALLKEGEIMKHCIATYLDDIYDGKYYVFHMEKPQILTIGIQIKKDKYRLSQIKGYRNSEATQEALAIIHNWFYQK